VLAAAFAGALAVDRWYFLGGLRHMALFSRAYNRHTKHSRYYRLGLSRFVDLKTVFGRRGWLGPRLAELENREPTRILFRHPELILLTWLAMQNGAGPFVIWPIIGATLIVYLLTATSQLRQFGEANRYIEFNLWLVVPLALGTILSSGTADARPLLL